MKRLLVASLAVLVSYAQVNLTTTGPTKATGASTIAGVPAGAEPPVSSPVISTATPLPDGDQDVPYTLNLLATGGVLPYSWSLVATETLPQATEVWTPVSGAMALTETFGDPGCSATDNVWPTPAGLVIDNTGKLTGNCSGTINGVDSAVVQAGMAAPNTWLSRELRFTTLPTVTSTALLFLRSATEANLCALRFIPSTGFVTISSSGGTAQNVFQPANDTRYKIGLYAERGVIAAEAECHARVATWNGSSYNAPGAWVESNNGTWTELIDNVRLPANANTGVWYIDSIERCQLGPVGDDFCGASAPDAYTTPSALPNNAYVDNSTVPISESLWSHNGADLILQIATDPDLSIIEVAAKPGGTLMLSAAGVLSGTPTASGTLNLTARVCDSVGSCSTKAFVLDINAAGPPPSGPWVSSFPTPIRTHYVEATGGCTSGGTCGEIGNPESLATANGHDACGDLHILRGGTYTLLSQLGTAVWGPNLGCTSGAPSVWKGYVNSVTGQPEQATIDGSIRPTGAHQWFVNLETTAAADVGQGFNVRGSDIHLINNVSHDQAFSSNILMGSQMRTRVYGNSLYRPACEGTGGSGAPGHNIYTNGGCEWGVRYIVHNISQETGCHPQQSDRLFQAYSGSVDLSCHHLEGNLFGDATATSNTVLFNAASGIPTLDIVIKNNFFVDHHDSANNSTRLGQSQPFQATVTGNYLARANMMFEGYHGNSGAHDDFIFTGNEIYAPPGGVHIKVHTRGVAGSLGSHKLPDADDVDNNIYGGTFVGQLFCNGTNFGNRTLAQWRTATDGCRVTPGSAGFDLNSTNPANPTVNKIEVIPNQWQCSSGCPFTDQARGNIYLVNWENAASDVVNISSVVGVSKQYVVRYARDFYGTAATSGTCPGSGACNVTLPTRRSSAEATGEFTNAYVITGQP